MEAQDAINSILPNVSNHLLSFIYKVIALLYIGLFFYFIEKIRPIDTSMKFFKRDFSTELCYPLFNFLLSEPLSRFFVTALTVFLLEPYISFQIFSENIGAFPFWLQVLTALLIADIAVYIEHRFVHKFMWPFHSMHHMADEVSWITTFRVHPVNSLTITITPIVVSFIIGFEGEAILWASWIISALAYFQHANLNIGYSKPFCYLLVSPKFHRWHHAREREAIDKNFCLVFPFLDLLGGTYYCPDRLPNSYGVFRGPHEDPIPGNFSGQLWYPFHSVIKSVGRLAKKNEGG